jgi:peptidyl-prolyl cis-trans isomerase A (cyclophilin A)
VNDLTFSTSGKHGVFGCLLLLLLAAAGSTTPAAAAIPTYKVRMYTNLGSVEIELYWYESPRHVENFLSHVDALNYDDSFTHRTRAANPSMPMGHNYFVQGGSFKLPIPPDTELDSNPVPLGNFVPNEFNAANGLTNGPGSLAAARSSHPDSARSGWFINQSNNSTSFDPGPYTVFGQVTSGMNIVNAIPFLPNRQDLRFTPFETMPWINNSATPVIVQRIRRIPIFAGDYDFNNVLEIADYHTWRANFRSTTYAGADGNGDGVVNAADYTIWRNAFASQGAGTSVVTPEPQSAVLLALAAGFLTATRRRRAQTWRRPCGSE